MKKILLTIVLLTIVLALAFTGGMYSAQANLSCGIPPVPPVGCTVGACFCDEDGDNCGWQFICR